MSVAKDWELPHGPPQLTALTLLMNCKHDKPTASGSNILLTKCKRKYVQLLLSSGVGGCYRPDGSS